MTLGNVQRVKVEEVSLYLSIVFDGIPKRNKDVFDPLTHQGDWMQVPLPRTASGNCYVDRVACGARCFNESRESFLFFVDRVGYCLLELLDIRAGVAAPLGVELSDEFLLI